MTTAHPTVDVVNHGAPPVEELKYYEYDPALQVTVAEEKPGASPMCMWIHYGIGALGVILFGSFLFADLIWAFNISQTGKQLADVFNSGREAAARGEQPTPQLRAEVDAIGQDVRNQIFKEPFGLFPADKIGQLLDRGDLESFNPFIPFVAFVLLCVTIQDICSWVIWVGQCCAYRGCGVVRPPQDMPAGTRAPKWAFIVTGYTLILCRFIVAILLPIMIYNFVKFFEFINEMQGEVRRMQY